MQIKVTELEMKFKCRDCTHERYANSKEELIPETGCCKACGSNNWVITDKNGVAIA